ncbi:GNAT family N-acetyltransferase [Brevibacterium album]|uniref:GNAT family N-acetyltransferase n=1 Tax=Brevibacterium album TaxID=417948 RepID=UPI00048E78FE|nr:GNAT family protein [Brevibacterium album]
MTQPALRFLRSADLPGDDASGERLLPEEEAAHATFHEALAALDRATCAAELGTPDLAEPAQTRRRRWAADANQHREAALVRAGGEEAPVGAWMLHMPLLDNLELAEIEVLVPPRGAHPATGGPGDEEFDTVLHGAVLADARARARELGRPLHCVFAPQPLFSAAGLGPALAGSGERADAEAHGPSRRSPERLGPGPRYRLLTEAEAEAGELLPVASGTGSVPADDPQVRLMREAGFRAVQMERFSVMELAAVPAQLPPVPAGCDFVQWHGETPPEHRAQMADLRTVFSATQPLGGAAFTPAVWDEERVRRTDEGVRAAGIEAIVTALADREDGRLLGFTVFEHTAGVPLAHQEITVVRPEARGRGFATALKRANAAQLRRLRPEISAVCTWNAVENLPMLAVNRAAGFVPRAFTVVWEADGRE